MSLSLYVPATKAGIIDKIYSDTGADTTKFPLMEITREINLALDNLVAIALQASGIWQLDDSNYTTDYPIITTNIISGQRDYSFITDGSGNLILDIYRIMCANSSGIFYDLELIDQQTKDIRTMGMVDGQNITGIPSKYDKTGNGIFLDAIPNYSYTNGLKIFINREASHFSIPTVNVPDTTKPGFDGRLHEYLTVRPTAYYTAKHGLKSAPFWQNELLKWEGNEDRGITGKIESIYSKRSKDEKTQIITKYRSSR